MIGLINKQDAINAVSEYALKHTDLDADKLNGLVKAIMKLPEPQRWIPVSERLPNEEDEKVLITDEYGDIDIAWFEFNEWTDEPRVEWWNGEYKVQPTAWMPLPEPYKDGD